MVKLVNHLLLAITSTIVLFLVACSPDDVTPTPERGDREIAVTIDVFSGRPNPSFVLAASEADQLAALAAQLVQAGQDDRPTGLGFRGFLLGVGDLPPGSVVAPDGVWTPDGTQYEDPDQQMFNYLREQAVTALGPEVNDLLE